MQTSRFAKEEEPTILRAPSGGSALQRMIDAAMARRRGEGRPAVPQARVGAVTDPADPRGGDDCKNGSCSSWNPFLPGVEVCGYRHGQMSPPTKECQLAAKAAGVPLYATQAGGRSLAAAVAAPIIVTITPSDCTSYWGSECLVSVFDASAQTRVFNGEVTSIKINGSEQIVGSPVPLLGYTETMPFLGVAWRKATPSNVITVTLVVRGAVGATVDAQVFSSGYAIR